MVVDERRPNRIEFSPLTQEFLAQVLGTRRASVTVAAGILQRAGLIAHTRGDVEIIDREKLEEAACECYGIMQTRIREWQADLQSPWATTIV